MTTTAQSPASIAAPLASEAQAVQFDQSEEKWPIPYSAMFMVSASAVLWYGIYSVGSIVFAMTG